MGGTSSRQEENNKRNPISSNNTVTETIKPVNADEEYDEKLTRIIRKYFSKISIIDIKPIVKQSHIRSRINNDSTAAEISAANALADDPVNAAKAAAYAYNTCFYDYQGNDKEENKYIKSDLINVKYTYEIVKTSDKKPAIKFIKTNKYKKKDLEKNEFEKKIRLSFETQNNTLSISRYVVNQLMTANHVENFETLNVDNVKISAFNIIFSSFNNIPISITIINSYGFNNLYILLNWYKKFSRHLSNGWSLSITYEEIHLLFEAVFKLKENYSASSIGGVIELDDFDFIETFINSEHENTKQINFEQINFHSNTIYGGGNNKKKKSAKKKSAKKKSAKKKSAKKKSAKKRSAKKK